MSMSCGRLLLMIVSVCASGAAFGWIGCVVILSGFGAVLYVCTAHPTRTAVIKVGCIALLAVCLLALFLPLVNFASAWSRQTMCVHRLRAISLALLNYHRDYGSFPPVCVRDKTGKPMHSWRVLILPYLGMEELYSQYNMSEPWNSPKNRELAALRPGIYACPNNTDTASSVNTSYLAVVGNGTVWPDSGVTTLDSIGDKLNETIQVVEVAKSRINWMEPNDLSFDSAILGINQKSGTSISSTHCLSTGVIYRETGACVAFCDGSGGLVSQDLPGDIIAALLTANGGEAITQDMLDARRLDWPKCLSISVLAVSLFLLLASCFPRHEKKGNGINGKGTPLDK